jgi:hypothetical protein
MSLVPAKFLTTGLVPLLIVASLFYSCQRISDPVKKALLTDRKVQVVSLSDRRHPAVKLFTEARSESKQLAELMSSSGAPDGLQAIDLSAKLVRINLYYLTAEEKFELTRFPEEENSQWELAGPFPMQWEEYRGVLELGVEPEREATGESVDLAN